MERIEWVRWYRRLMTGATLQEAMEAWEQQGPGGAGDPAKLEKRDWVKQYRSLMPCTTQEALEAWERNENGAQQERMEAGAP